MSEQSSPRKVDPSALTRPPQPAKRYPLHTYSLTGKLSLKQATDALYPGVTERVNQDCLVCHLSAEEKLFIFRFGAVVFFNVPVGGHENFLNRLNASSKQRPQQLAEEFAEDEVFVAVESGVTSVGFNIATIPEFDITMIQLVAQLLAQSSALELIEWEVEEFLAQSEELTQFLKGNQHRRPTRSELLKFLGEGLSTRHKIVNQLGALNEPEKTWEREQLYKFYRDLYKMFDIPERVENIEKMLSLTGDVSELLLEIANARRTEILELIIIALITFEILQTLYDKFG